MTSQPAEQQTKTNAARTLVRLARCLAWPSRAIQRRSPYGPESGQALVEFALVVPLLLVLLLGILDFGKGYNYWIDQTHLANQAARWAAVNKNPGPGTTLQASVQQRANTKELRQGGTASVPSPVSVSICFPDGTSNVGDPVRVTVNTTYNWLGFLVAKSGIPLSSSIRGTATMRLEAEPTAYTADGPCP